MSDETSRFRNGRRLRRIRRGGCGLAFLLVRSGLPFLAGRAAKRAIGTQSVTRQRRTGARRHPTACRPPSSSCFSASQRPSPEGARTSGRRHSASKSSAKTSATAKRFVSTAVGLRVASFAMRIMTILLNMTTTVTTTSPPRRRRRNRPRRRRVHPCRRRRPRRAVATTTHSARQIASTSTARPPRWPPRRASACTARTRTTSTAISWAATASAGP